MVKAGHPSSAKAPAMGIICPRGGPPPEGNGYILVLFIFVLKTV
jgi:hypothetical protein